MSFISNPIINEQSYNLPPTWDSLESVVNVIPRHQQKLNLFQINQRISSPCLSGTYFVSMRPLKYIIPNFSNKPASVLITCPRSYQRIQYLNIFFPQLENTCSFHSATLLPCKHVLQINPLQNITQNIRRTNECLWRRHCLPGGYHWETRSADVRQSTDIHKRLILRGTLSFQRGDKPDNL